MKRALLIAAPALLIVFAFGTGTASAAKVFAPEDCGKAVARPETVSLACADDNIYVSAINWKNWGGRNSGGNGTLVVNNCNPNCAADKFKTYPVHISLRKVRIRKCQTKKRVPMYRTAVLSFPANQPSFAASIRKSKLGCDG